MDTITIVYQTGDKHESVRLFSHMLFRKWGAYYVNELTLLLSWPRTEHETTLEYVCTPTVPLYVYTSAHLNRQPKNPTTYVKFDTATFPFVR